MTNTLNDGPLATEQFPLTFVARSSRDYDFAARRMFAMRIVLLAMLLLGAVSGCHSNLQVESQQTQTTKSSRSAGAQDNASVLDDQIEPASDSKSGLRESWDVIYMGKAKIGYSRTTTTSITEQGRELRKIVNETQTTMQRFGDTTHVGLTVTSVETPTGQVVRFTSRQEAGSAVMKTLGQHVDGTLKMETTTPGKSVTESIPWESSWRGYFGFEQSLRDQPLQPGETRSVRCLLPVFNAPATVVMKATDYVDTPMVTGTRRLLKIESEIDIQGNKIPQVLWMDQDGELLKSLVPSMNQYTYRTTREVALGATDEFDLGNRSLVEVNRRLDDPHGSQRIVYRAKLEMGDLSNVFPDGVTQDVKRLNATSVEITVSAVTPDHPETVGADASEQPTTGDLQASNLIQSDDRQIREIADSVRPDETDPWIVACALESHVRDLITEKSFTQAFATAAEVVATREGDCTEHAVLLAALCRARQIPARVAIGLVYVPGGNAGRFAYHMWSEVWIKDRWIPLDATLGRGGIGAAHIKISSSNLQGSSAYSTFLPVIQVIGHLQLEIISVQ